MFIHIKRLFRTSVEVHTNIKIHIQTLKVYSKMQAGDETLHWNESKLRRRQVKILKFAFDVTLTFSSGALANPSLSSDTAPPSEPPSPQQGRDSTGRAHERRKISGHAQYASWEAARDPPQRL